MYLKFICIFLILVSDLTSNLHCYLTAEINSVANKLHIKTKYNTLYYYDENKPDPLRCPIIGFLPGRFYLLRLMRLMSSA